MAIPTEWYHWDTTGMNGPAEEWSHLAYYFNNIVFTCYWLESHQCDWRENTVIALWLIKQKCDAMQSQIDALGEPAEVTMDSILSAMITASYEQLQTFIGIEDAYRVALWNEWFNVEYYASLARGFAFGK